MHCGGSLTVPAGRSEVSTFVFGRDVLGDEIAEKLKQRARAGVRVRLLIDGIGIYLGGYPDLKGFAQAGVEVIRFVPPFRSPKRGRTNLRNHRKMVIADGLHLWCGGRNLSAEYFEGDPRPILGSKPWLDLSFDLGGELARQAQQQFEQDGLSPPNARHLSRAVPHYRRPLRRRWRSWWPAAPTSRTTHFLPCWSPVALPREQRILAATPYSFRHLRRDGADAGGTSRHRDRSGPARSNHRLADFARHRSLRDLVAAGGKSVAAPAHDPRQGGADRR